MTEGQSPPSSGPSGSAARALSVLKAIIRYGPQKPDEICEHTALPRTAVHRAIHVLIDQGMLRYQLGRRQVMLCGDWHGQIPQKPISPAALDGVVYAISTAIKGTRLQADLAVLTKAGHFRVVEATDPSHLGPEDDPMASDLFIAALIQFDRSGFLAVTTHHLDRGGTATAPPPEFIARYQLGQQHRHLWDKDAHELSVPLGRRGDSALALRLWSREATPQKRRIYPQTLEKIYWSNPVLFPHLKPSSG